MSSNQVPFIVFLCEEISMKNTLLCFFRKYPELAPKEYLYNIFDYSGKTDLVKQLPSIIKCFKNGYSDIRFMILHDKDSADCVFLKSKLVEIIEKNNINNRKYLVRIVCTELESWYLGNIDEIRHVYRIPQNKLNYENPDAIANAKEELKEYNYQVSHTRTKELGKYLDPRTNKSISFQSFIKGLEKLKMA